MVEAAPVAKGKSEAAPKSAPRGRVFGEHAAWVRTAYDALKEKYEPGADKAIDAAKKHRPGFPFERGAKKISPLARRQGRSHRIFFA